MLWLIATILSYLILAVVFLIDKHLLSTFITNPKIYAFYVGVLGISALILAPFINFYVPSLEQILLSFLAGLFFLYALFSFYRVLSLFEASQIVPAVGGFLPIFSFLLAFLISRGKETLEAQKFLAFIFLILGTVLISYKKNSSANSLKGKVFSKKSPSAIKSLYFSAGTAFVWAMFFLLAKYVYSGQNFLNGFLWIRIGAGFFAFLLFAFSKEVKKEVFKIKLKLGSFLSFKKTTFVFIFNQVLGVIANLLQNWAISLAPLIYISLITALQGVQYLFLLIFVTIISLKFPWLLKEEISKKIFFQKLLAILLIGAGFTLLIKG